MAWRWKGLIQMTSYERKIERWWVFAEILPYTVTVRIFLKADSFSWIKNCFPHFAGLVMPPKHVSMTTNHSVTFFRGQSFPVPQFLEQKLFSRRTKHRRRRPIRERIIHVRNRFYAQPCRIQIGERMWGLFRGGFWVRVERFYNLRFLQSCLASRCLHDCAGKIFWKVLGDWIWPTAAKQ